MSQPGPRATSGHFHAVRFYKDSESLSRIVAEFIGEGFVKGAPAVVIARPEHRDLILRHLRDRAFDVETLKRRNDLVVLDARDTLSKFCTFGKIDTARFDKTVIPLLEELSRGRGGECTIRAFGEMVDVLWKDGFSAASIRLEMLWNQLAGTYDLKLLCGYSMGNFYKGASIEEITCTHTHVVAADGESRAIHRV
jgi:hypothetical protein